MSSPLYTAVRKLNFLSMSTPKMFQKAQIVARDVGVPEIAAAARWGVAGSILFYWCIEHHFEDNGEGSS